MTSNVRTALRRAAVPLAGVAAALAVGACSAGGAPTWAYPAANAAQAPGAGVLAAPPAAVPMAIPAAASMNMPGMAQAAAPAAEAQSEPAGTHNLNLTIVTGDMIGHTEFPALIPADFTLPANSTVVVTVTNFDDATALPKGSEQFANVSGTVGNTVTVTPIKAPYPNGSAGPEQTTTSLDPANVSHTLTIPALGINVPIAPHARETFTIRTGRPGIYSWHCMDPCGAGTTGWGTAMAMKKGFMEGTITVVG